MTAGSFASQTAVELSAKIATRSRPSSFAWYMDRSAAGRGRLVVQQVHDQQGNHGQGMSALLAIDAWEHAYQPKFPKPLRLSYGVASRCVEGGGR